MKVQPLLLAALIAVASCAAHLPGVGLMATPPPSGRVIGFDPSVVGLPGAIGDTVYDSAGIISWIKYDTSNTAWRPVPVSQFVTGDPSQAPGLKAPIGFVVTMTDGSASWIKSTTSDTGWVVNPSSGGGSFTSDTSILQNNSASAPVQTLRLRNPFSSNTAGSESSFWRGTVLSLGAATDAFQAAGTYFAIPVTAGTPGIAPLGLLSGLGGLAWDTTNKKLDAYDLVNNTWTQVGGGAFTGHQTYTTVSATDTVAMSATADYLDVIVGVDATTFQVTGLSLNADLRWRFNGQALGNGITMSLRMNGNSGDDTCIYTYIEDTGAAGTGGALTNALILDAPTASSTATWEVDVWGTSGNSKNVNTHFNTLVAGHRYDQRMTCFTTSTADVTSIDLFATGTAMKAGSVFTIARTRSINN